MEENHFQCEMMKAQTFIELGEDSDYWMGYQRGLRRRFHGENFGTDEEHEMWMQLYEDSDDVRANRGRGYRDGFISRIMKIMNFLLELLKVRKG